MDKKTKINKKIPDKIENTKINSVDVKNRNVIPWIVFIFSISIVLISFVSVIFPALFLVSDTVIIPELDQVTPDPFEPGV